MMVSSSMFMLAYVSVLSVLAAGGAVCWSVLNVRRLRALQEMAASDLADALREIELLAAKCARAVQWSGRIERDCAALSERVGLLELRGESRLYNQAIDSARNGADPAKLARQFGLSSTEANLLLLVHGARSGSA